VGSTRREWLALAVVAVGSSAITRGHAAAGAQRQGGSLAGQQELAPSIARIADVTIEERVEPALVFLPRQS
jgi:phage terminase small subunit